MISSNKEINLLCTSCNGLLNKISFCLKCTLPFHPHCIDSICVSCTNKQDLKLIVEKKFELCLNKLTKLKKMKYKDFFVPFCTKKCTLCNKKALYFYNNYFCKGCFYRISKNNFCSVCKITFDDNDFETKMVRCDFCIKWIHLSCTNLSHNDYKRIALCENESEHEFCCKSCEHNIKKFKKYKEAKTECKEKCLVCGVGYLNEDPIFTLYPCGNKFKHLNCNFLEEKCAVCTSNKPATVKCSECIDSFHTFCSLGLFRQNNIVSMCNAHYKIKDHKKIASKFICNSIKETKFEPGMFLFSKNVIYKRNEFLKFYFGDYKIKNENYVIPVKLLNQPNTQINVLSFNGEHFYFNGVQTDLTELKVLGMDFEKEDIFKIETKEFMSFRKFIDFLFFKRFCEVIKSDKYFFGDN